MQHTHAAHELVGAGLRRRELDDRSLVCWKKSTEVEIREYNLLRASGRFLAMERQTHRTAGFDANRRWIVAATDDDREELAQ